MNKYTEEEIDYVIDNLDLGFMRNRIKNSPEDINLIMNTVSAFFIILLYRIKNTIKLVIGSLTK